MRLVSLYIENFGGLSRYALDFEQNLTVIEAANGFGKTTLAEFIRAMFYGFPRKAKTLDKSLRQKYTPWNGGKFGGNLVFEAENTLFRVERSFGATPKADSFALIDLSTGRKSSRYGENLGLELFQLDADSFERSTYLPQLSEGPLMTTDSIRSKLSNLVEDTNDVGNFEKAMAALKAKRTTFVPYRGSGGSVMQAGSRISALQEQLHQAQNQERSLSEIGVQITQLQQEQETDEAHRDRLRREIRQAAQAAAVASAHRQQARLEKQQTMLRETQLRLEEKYPAGIPEPEQIEQARNLAARLEILKSRSLTGQEELEAQAFVEANRDRFARRLPSEPELAQCRSRCGDISALREKLLLLASETEDPIQIKTDPLALILLILTTVAAAAAGTALLMLRQTLWGAVALGIGAAALIGCIVAGVRLSGRRRALRCALEARQKKQQQMEQLSAQVQKLTEEVEAYLSAFGPVDGGDLFALLIRLEHDREAYRRAESRVAQWQTELAEHEAELEAVRTALAKFMARAGLTADKNISEQLLQLRDDRKDREELMQQQQALAQELAQFREENSEALAYPMPEETADADALRLEEENQNRRINARAEMLLRLQQRQDMLQEQVCRIPQLQEELQLWQEKKQADQKRAELLDETMTALEQAKENLSGAYLGPLRSGFAGYLKRLWDTQDGQVLVTPDLQVQLERMGEARELGYFSAGQTDTVMLCMRLALVDALFAAEKPFVILDDPFINLDDLRTAQALKLLQELSQDRQIIYLTCNSSRIPR